MALILRERFGRAYDAIARLPVESVFESGLCAQDCCIPWSDFADLATSEFSPIDWLLKQKRLGFPRSPLFFRLQPPGAAELRVKLALKEAKQLVQERELQSDKPGRLPDFLVLGAPRCATTWLHAVLSTHPGVHLGRSKESEFFTDHRFAGGIGYYAAHFSEAKNNQLVGDISVGYLHSNVAPRRILKALPSCRRFIIMLREPVERAQSYYEYRLHNSLAPATIEESFEWAEYRDILIEQGKYGLDIERWLAVFPRSNFLFILNDDVVKNPARVVDSVLDFIGAERIPFKDLGRGVNERRQVRAPAIYQKIRRAELISAARLGRASHLFTQPAAGLRRLLSAWGREKVLKPDTVSVLRAEFRPHTFRLQSTIGRDLSIWLNPGTVIF